jgi:SAM-dependent MidA family methyltransferase
MSELRRFIEEEIRKRGPMPFSRYMALCLYGDVGSIPGYYSGERQQFGKAGDFYTSSDVHAVFGRLLSRQFEQMWRMLDSPARLDLLEVGPGRGLFVQDVIDWSIKKFPQLAYAMYVTLVETSEGLRAKLEEKFRERIERRKVAVYPGFDDFRWTSDNAIVFANELFDAMPVEIVSGEGQLYVDVQNGALVERFQPPTPDVHAYIDRYSVTPAAGQRVEVNLAALRFVRTITTHVRHGFCVFIDYGYTRDEQLQGRHLDTLMTYRQHSAGTNPFEAPGEQDITAHVNFTAIAETAREVGWDVFPLVTQSQFLLGIGEETQFGDAFEECKLPQEQAKVALQLKHLATPAGMGDIFHVLVLSRGIETEKAARLDGLKFATEVSPR